MFKGILRQIANTVYINAQFMEQYGLLTGKFGTILFFYNYARYTGNSIYSDFADGYMDNLFNTIEQVKTTDFANGLSGIGWGIQTLVNNDLVQADEDLLDDVDIAIAKMNIQSFYSEISNEIPLFSKGLYFLKRKNREMISETIFQCKEFLNGNIQYGHTIPLTYVSSIIYFLNQAQEMNIETNVCNQIFTDIASLLSKELEPSSDLEFPIFVIIPRKVIDYQPF